MAPQITVTLTCPIALAALHWQPQPYIRSRKRYAHVCYPYMTQQMYAK